MSSHCGASSFSDSASAALRMREAASRMFLCAGPRPSSPPDRSPRRSLQIQHQVSIPHEESEGRRGRKGAEPWFCVGHSGRLREGNRPGAVGLLRHDRACQLSMWARFQLDLVVTAPYRTWARCFRRGCERCRERACRPRDDNARHEDQAGTGTDAGARTGILPSGWRRRRKRRSKCTPVQTYSDALSAQCELHQQQGLSRSCMPA